MSKNKKIKRGLDLSRPEEHAKDHKNWSRRSFLSSMGIAGAATVGVGSLPFTALHGFPLESFLGGDVAHRKLVLIRLKGGNDGLNTIVPLFDFDTYKNARPVLGFDQNELFNLNDDFAMPNVMEGVRSLWDNGRMRVINSVGYEFHNLSHFTGADIMASGNNDVDNNGDGWLARYYTSQNPNYIQEPPSFPPAVKIGGPTSIIFNDENKVDISANFSTAERLEKLAQSGLAYNNIDAPDACYYGEQVIFLRTIANAASRYSQSIFEAYNKSQDGTYRTSLGDQLRLVARLIKGGLDTQLYLVTLDGFDTHVSQNTTGSHLELLQNVSEAVEDFYADLRTSGHDEDVLSMTYSEFGRRVEENGFAGTDHGTALPIMMFGPALNGSGIHGKNPDLKDLDDAGNLKYGTDFRSVYATILESWFCIEPDLVDQLLGANYDRVNSLGFSCITSTQNGSIDSQVVPVLRQLGSGRFAIDVELNQTSDLGLVISAISGQILLKKSNSFYSAGKQSLEFNLDYLPNTPTPLIYTLIVNGRPISDKFLALP